jgi:PHD/YefM family antitoxin component YafN of YafNO toxin-antitoxin module
MLSLKEYQALEETTYLFNTRENASRLLTSITELEAEHSQNPSSTTELAKMTPIF